MFCNNCGKQLNPGEVCTCQQGAQPAQTAQQPNQFQQQMATAANDFYKAATARFSINQLIAMGAMALMVIFYFLPFVDLGFASRSAYGLVFNSEQFGNIWVLIVPVLALVGCTFMMKGDRRNLACFIIAFAGACYPMTYLFHDAAGVGVYLCFVAWAVAAAAYFMEMKGINLFKK